MISRNWLNYKKNFFYKRIKNFYPNIYLNLKKTENIFLYLYKKYFFIKIINKIEFKKFSQNCEDGVLDFIINKIKIKKINSIEIGFDPLENNLIYNTVICKRGKLNIFVEMNNEKCLLLRHLSNFFKTDFKNNVKLINKKITPKNINKFISSIFKKKEIDIFSLDIDGLDYYVLREINFYPKIMIIEYNKYFQKNPITILYDPKHKWHGRKDLYWGASITAINDLMKKKGYFLAYMESSFVNAFFVRNDYKNLFKEINYKAKIDKATGIKYSYYKQSPSLKFKKYYYTR